MLHNFLLLGATLVGTVIFFMAPGSQALIGPGLIILAWLIALIFTIPHKPPATRGQWAFWACFALITAIATSIIFLYVQEKPIYINSGNLDVHITVGPKPASSMFGLLIGAIGAVFLFALIGYFSSIYILSLHKEDLTFWEAFRSFISLILNKQYTWLKVEDGNKIEIKEKGYKPSWFSLGKIVVRAGHAIVLQKGGTITRIEGPGTVVTEKGEEIKTILDLGSQFVLSEVTDVITADRIPLTIKMGAGCRLKPAANPNIPGVIKEKNFGFFPVELETLRKAAFSDRDSLRNFARNMTIGQLRDQIMAHRFDELFEVQGTNQDLTIRVNSRRIKLIEDAIKNTINTTVDNGAEITTVDISEIHFPERIKDRITEERVSQIDAKAIVTKARARAQEIILKGQGEGEAQAAFFREVIQELKKEEGLSDVELVSELLKQMISTMASVQELQTLVKSTAFTERLSRRLGDGSLDSNGHEVYVEYPRA